MKDGDLNKYNLSNSGTDTPHIIYVNGIQTAPGVHAWTAAYLSVLLERPVWGVFNATAGVDTVGGFLGDIGQCILDFAQNAVARPFSPGKFGKPAKVSEEQIPAFLDSVRTKYVVWNEATLTLFTELVRHRHRPRRIVAHSQGNLITSNALFVLEDVLGSAGLETVRVYSLASPSPAWPVGLRVTNGGGGRQDNAYMNDPVALLRPHNLAAKVGVGGVQNAGDFRTYTGPDKSLIGPHKISEIIPTLNFLKSVRNDLGVKGDITPELLQKAAAQADAAFPLPK